MTYSDAIEQIMLNNGYIAPLKLLYKEIWKYKDISSIRGKTPDMTIQERVQRDKRFTKIGLGIYALTDKIHLLEKQSIPKTDTEFEVENSTDFRDVFLKFLEMQYFLIDFICVSPLDRKSKFDIEINRTAFKPIRNRIRFLSYEEIENDYTVSIAKTYI